jgi:hypothetical protein
VRHTRLCVVGIFASLTIVAGPSATAAPVDFDLDPARSTFRLGGTLNDLPLGPQTAGSDVTGYTGKLVADIDRSAGTLSTLTFTPRALNQSVDQQPLATSEVGANYGLTHSGTLPIFLAPRGMDLNVRLDNAPFNAGAPPNDRVPFFVNGGTLYYSTPDLPMGFADLHGYGGADDSFGPITLTREGDLEVLTIPISTSFTPYTGENGDVIHFTLDGQLVGTRVVPEPACAAGLLVLPLLLARRRR